MHMLYLTRYCSCGESGSGFFFSCIHKLKGSETRNTGYGALGHWVSCLSTVDFSYLIMNFYFGYVCHMLLLCLPLLSVL